MIVVEEATGTPVGEQAVEVVARKGVGHADPICDRVAAPISVALCREYAARCGAILHHNVDKCLLAAGEVRLDFGGGELLRPMELVVGDRATIRAGGRCSARSAEGGTGRKSNGIPRPFRRCGFLARLKFFTLVKNEEHC